MDVSHLTVRGCCPSGVVPRWRNQEGIWFLCEGCKALLFILVASLLSLLKIVYTCFLPESFPNLFVVMERQADTSNLQRPGMWD